jgi:hypothetical protein
LFGLLKELSNFIKFKISIYEQCDFLNEFAQFAVESLWQPVSIPVFRFYRIFTGRIIFPEIVDSGRRLAVRNRDIQADIDWQRR